MNIACAIAAAAAGLLFRGIYPDTNQMHTAVWMRGDVAVISISGPMASTLPAVMREALALKTDRLRVCVNTGGGSMVAGITTAVMMRLRESTIVSLDCESACGLLLVAAKKRLAVPNTPFSGLGFHDVWSKNGEREEVSLVRFAANSFYAYYGVAPWFTNNFRNYGRGHEHDMWYPSRLELEKANLQVDGISRGRAFELCRR